MATRTRQGEPFELAAKRLSFMDYGFIRPAGFGWYDDKGQNVTVVGDQCPWDAEFRTLDRPFGFRIVALPAERSCVPYALEPEKPWEEEGIQLTHLLQDEDDGYYKAWGTCRAAGTDYRCYVQSRDFETWERPEAGVVEFAGTKRNNLVELEGEGLSHGTIFKDASRPDEPWKWLSESAITREEYDAYRQKYPDDWDPKSDRVDVARETHVGPGNLIEAVRGAVSADGFRWKSLPEPLVVEHSDTTVTAYYDRKLKKYVGYFRDWMITDRSHAAPDDRGLSWMAGRRCIGRAETEDFRHFPLSEIIFEPGPELLGPSDVLYTNGHTVVPHAPDQHVFFPTVWHQDDDTTSVGIASSRDGKVLHWLPGGPVLGTAPFMQWDGGCVFANGGLMELPDGRWVLPYSGFNFPHKYPRGGPFKYGLGFATWNKGRMVALEARERGQFATFALQAPGTRLRVNALTKRAGSLKVEVTDLERRPIAGRSFGDCAPIIGDQYRTPVTWTGCDNIGVPADTPVCLRFQLEKAQLFFVDFE